MSMAVITFTYPGADGAVGRYNVECSFTATEETFKALLHKFLPGSIFLGAEIVGQGGIVMMRQS